MRSTLTAIPAPANREPAAAPATSASVVVLSTSLLTERMLLYTDFLDVLGSRASVTLWSAARKAPSDRQRESVRFEPFPAVKPFREFYNLLRRLNEFTWDAAQRTPSRVSITSYRHYETAIRALKAPAWLLAAAGLERQLEDRLERLLLDYPRSPEALERLQQLKPSVLVTTGPFQFEQPAVVAAARHLGIRTLALIPSWDNVSTKNRMVYKYDGYLVWSDWTRRELREMYPQSRNVPVYVVGAPQFDVFFQERFRQSREAFCHSQGLRPDLPIIVHAIGSPNFLREHHAAIEMAKRVVAGDLGDVQLLIRPHPIHDKAEFGEMFSTFGPRVVVQKTADAKTPLEARSQDTGQILEWVNTFRHADVVVNLSSTVTVDAAIFDRPVVNLDYDPEPGRPNQALVKDVNHLWTHFKPIAESGGVWLVNNTDEMVDAVRTYLAHPELHREKRRWIADTVCGHLDGHCGERLARAMIDFEAGRRPADDESMR
jgi:hypothetical protein